MNTKYLLASAIAATLTVSGAVKADDRKNSFNFKAIDSSANAADWDATLAAAIAGASIFVIRLLAIKFNISLPKFRFRS